MVTDSKPIKPWYRRLAFRMSIRGLIVLVLIVGGTLGWLGHRARVQREAVAAIKRPGVFINYDWEYHDGILDPRAICPWPKWLVDTVGIDYLSSVTQVQIYSPVGQVRATDADLLQIGKLSRLESLWLKGDQITEAGFASVAGLSRVNQLAIELYGIKGEWLKHLSKLSRLEVVQLAFIQSLSLSNTGIGDEAVGFLKDSKKLEGLMLSGTNVSDKGLTWLAELKSLKFLTISQTHVTAEAYKKFQATHPSVSVYFQ